MLTRLKQHTPDRLQGLAETVGSVCDMEIMGTRQPQTKNDQLLRRLRSQQCRNKKQQYQKEDLTSEGLISEEEEALEYSKISQEQRADEEIEGNENATQFGEGIGEEIGEEARQCNMNIQGTEDEGTLENQQENPEIENLQEDAWQTTEEVCPASYVENNPQDQDIMKENPTTNTNMILYQDTQIEHPLHESSLVVVNLSDHTSPVAFTVQNDVNLISIGMGGTHGVPKEEQGMSLLSNTQLWRIVTQLQQSNQQLQLQLQTFVSQDKGATDTTGVEENMKILNVKPIGSNQSHHLHEDMQIL